MPGFPVHHQLSELAQTHVHWVSDAIQALHLLPSPSPPAFNFSQHQGLFQWVSSLHQVAKILELQLHHQSFLSIFRTDFLLDWLNWFPCSPRDSQESSPIPQSKSINSSVLSFLIVQLSHPYMITGKTIALTRWTFVSKVLSLLFNMLSRLVIAFLPRNKHLLISWLQSPTALILEPKKIKSLAVSIVFPSICYEVMGLDAMIFIFWMLTFKPPFLLSSFTFIKRLFSSSSLSAIYLWELRWCQGTEARSAPVPNRMFLDVYVSDLWKYNLSPSKQGGIMSCNHSISTYIPQPEEKKSTLCSC